MGGAADFLIIGAARCGTTALASFLQEHPDIFISTPKEPHLLAFWPTGVPHFVGPGDDDLINRRAVRTELAWRQLFRDRPERRLGEGSVTTLCHPETAIPAIERLCAPECQVIVLLRDPVERAWSSWQYLRSRGHDGGSFEACLAAEDERTRAGWSHLWQLRRLSRYAEQLGPFIDAFGDRVLVVVQEELAADPQRELRRVLAFLDVDPDVALDVDRQVNEGGLPRSRTLASAANLLRRSSRATQLVKAVVPERHRERIRSANLQRTGLEPATRAALASSFAADLEALQGLLDRDLPRWPSVR